MDNAKHRHHFVPRKYLWHSCVVSEIARFTPGDRTLRLVMDIAAALERYRIVMEGPAGVRLRKLNHIRTIRGTTAIEGNTLTEGQVTDIIAGKRVAGSKREIDEVKGAHAAYSKVEAFDPLSSRALLRAHALMTKNEHWEVIETRRKQ